MRSLPQVIPPMQTGNPLDAGTVTVFLVLGAFYTLSLPVLFHCENGKIQAIVLLLFFFDCSLAAGLFLIHFFGLYPTFKVRAVFAVNAVVQETFCGPCSLTPCWTDERLFFPGVSPTLSTTSALTMENMEGIVGIAGSYTVTAIHFVIILLLVDFSQKGTSEKFDVYVKHASPFQHNLWVVLVIIFAVFTTNTFTMLYINHLM